MNKALEIPKTQTIRQSIRSHYIVDEVPLVEDLARRSNLSEPQRASIVQRAADIITEVRQSSKPSIMESFLAEYGLTTKEGVALMCLAEALLRVPDGTTLSALIEDKIGTGEWSSHAGRANSALVNTATFGLMAAGKLFAPLDDRGLSDTLRGLVRRMGNPVVRSASQLAMKEMGRQFVLGRSIGEAAEHAKEYEEKGYFYSYDMLGEAARTESDARLFFESYSSAIDHLSKHCRSTDIRDNPGISVKLSALHPRYEAIHRDRVMAELVPRARALMLKAKRANMGFNIDAEEADRLDLSLDVIDRLLNDSEIAGWEGFGVVVQAYGPRASFVLDWLYEQARSADRKIMVRLVKGAYWDAEIKRAQVFGLEGFPVFTRKLCTDISYITCAEKLLSMTDHIYPQFATHNAHSVAAVLEMAEDYSSFEFQRLHGMGESLYVAVLAKYPARCRIYAPVGEHKELLAYLVRRLLENGANSSFVNQIVDTRITAETIAADPFDQVVGLQDGVLSANISPPSAIYGPERINARGWDITAATDIDDLDRERNAFKTHQWTAVPMLDGEVLGGDSRAVRNPANPDDRVGTVTDAAPQDVETAVQAAAEAQIEWAEMGAEERAAILLAVADSFEAHAGEFFALATREAGKTLADGIAEVREAVDFARYYAVEARGWLDGVESVGTVVCISPWNFPLAIFAGQIFANIGAGNAVLAKPAPQTTLMAARAIELMYEAGVPRGVVQLLPGAGEVGQQLSALKSTGGLCFTGSTVTAQAINRAMAEHGRPDAFLVAETGGLNAMVVDSTALPEQVVRDVVASAFQSAGQRCSALRVLYVQEDIADQLLTMLKGAMDELSMGDPWELSTDVGPVIDETAHQKISAYIELQSSQDRILKRLNPPNVGTFIPPTLIKIDSIADLDEEVFGPVLHVATFAADAIDSVIDAINETGFGLTFGMHSRVDSRTRYLAERVKVGNAYINRNQIGAIVGSQPFGGEGLSGTGPKAGGPQYVRRMLQSTDIAYADALPEEPTVAFAELQTAIEEAVALPTLPPDERFERMMMITESPFEPLDRYPTELPGPTGERNEYRCLPKGVVVCAGPTVAFALTQALAALAQGNRVVVVAPGCEIGAAAIQDAGLPIVALPGVVAPSVFEHLEGFDAVAFNGDRDSLRACKQALAMRPGALMPLITDYNCAERFVLERHICTDTTAAGGNASLIAASG